MYQYKAVTCYPGRTELAESIGAEFLSRFVPRFAIGQVHFMAHASTTLRYGPLCERPDFCLYGAIPVSEWSL